MGRLIAALLAVSWLNAPALAAAQPEFTVAGAGNNSCGSWTQTRANRDPDIVYEMEGWVEGFITAMNAIRKTSGKSQLLNGVDADSLFGWIDNYCAAHPLASLAKATVLLTAELMDRADGRPAPPAN